MEKTRSRHAGTQMLADISATSCNVWLMCSAVPEFSTKQRSIWKEEVKKDVGCRGHNVALESGSSRFKSRLSQLRVPKSLESKTQESFGLSFLHSWLF